MRGENLHRITEKIKKHPKFGVVPFEEYADSIIKSELVKMAEEIEAVWIHGPTFASGVARKRVPDILGLSQGEEKVKPGEKYPSTFIYPPLVQGTPQTTEKPVESKRECADFKACPGCGIHFTHIKKPSEVEELAEKLYKSYCECRGWVSEMSDEIKKEFIKLAQVALEFKKENK